MGLILVLIILVFIGYALLGAVVGCIWLIGAAGYHLSVSTLAILTISYLVIVYFKTPFLKYADWEVNHMQNSDFSFLDKLRWYFNRERAVDLLLVAILPSVVWSIAFFVRWDGTENFFNTISNFIFRQ